MGLIETAVTTAAFAALGGKDLCKRLLGPTADYIGGEVQMFTEKRVNQVKKIFLNAEKKAAAKLADDGAVPPKVLRGVLDEGSYSDDEFAVEYFGGVLASSRSGVSRDDRGAYFNSLISRLSSYQLRTHYIVYAAIKQMFDGRTDIKIGIETARADLRLFIPLEDYVAQMDFTEAEGKMLASLVPHVVNGLIKEGLIDNYFKYGAVEYLQSTYPKINSPGLVVQPSSLGIELFYWAHGRGELSIVSFLDSTNKFSFDTQIKVCKGFTRIKE